jgi:hypothetical protein
MCGARSAPHFLLADQNQCPLGVPDLNAPNREVRSASMN